MAKKFICAQDNFLAITFEPVDWFIPNFEGAKIYMVGGFFAEGIIPWVNNQGLYLVRE